MQLIAAGFFMGLVAGAAEGSPVAGKILRGWELTLSGALYRAPGVIQEATFPRERPTVRELGNQVAIRAIEGRCTLELGEHFGLQLLLGHAGSETLREEFLPPASPFPPSSTYVASRTSSRRELSATVLPTWSLRSGGRLRLDLGAGVARRELRYRQVDTYVERATGAVSEVHSQKWSSSTSALVTAAGLAMRIGHHGLVRVDISYPVLRLGDDAPGEVDFRWSLGVGAHF